MIKVVLTVILAVVALGFLGSTIGLAVTRNKKDSKKDDYSPVQACDDVPGYVKSFISMEDLAEQYVGFTEKDDASLLSSMLDEDTGFPRGQEEYAAQASVLEGTISAIGQLGRNCTSPGTVSTIVTDRYDLVDSYSKMTYKDFLNSQGIYS